MKSLAFGIPKDGVKKRYLMRKIKCSCHDHDKISLSSSRNTLPSRYLAVVENFLYTTLEKDTSRSSCRMTSWLRHRNKSNKKS